MFSFLKRSPAHPFLAAFCMREQEPRPRRCCRRCPWSRRGSRSPRSGGPAGDPWLGPGGPGPFVGPRSSGIQGRSHVWATVAWCCLGKIPLVSYLFWYYGHIFIVVAIIWTILLLSGIQDTYISIWFWTNLKYLMGTNISRFRQIIW